MDKCNQIKQITYKNKTQKKEKILKYFYFNLGRNELVSLNKKEFKDIEAPVINHKGKLLKYRGCTRKEAENLMKFVPESIFDDIRETFEGFKFLLDLCKKIGNIKTNLSEDVILNLVRVCYSLVDIVSSFDYNKMIRLLIDLYCVFHKKIDLFKKQSLESVFLMLGSIFMPENLLNILKKLQILSSVKILDEYSHLTQFLDGVFMYIDQFCDYIKLPQYFKDALIKIGIYHNKRTVISKTEEILEDWKKNKNIVYNAFFQERVRKLITEWDNPIMDDWIRRSGGVSGLKNKFDVLNKVVFSVTNLTRQEPCCFVFEGPPGCMKSHIMNQIVSLLEDSVYTHVTKSSTDGKDFYDNYNNERIFVMDDVGQQGVDQWRNIINMVSTTQYKLDCAAQHLKDLKIFTSSLILVTTNSFMQLPNLTRQDGIADVRALWRRGYVFDFGEVRRIGAGIQGKIKFKYYDIKTNEFVNGFPKELSQKLKDHGLITPEAVHVINGRGKLLSWILRIIKSFDLLKGDHEVAARLLPSEVKEILEEANPFRHTQEDVFFDAQSKFSFSYISEVILDVIREVKNKFVEHPIEVVTTISLLSLLYMGYNYLTKTKLARKVFKLESLEGVKFDFSNNERLTSIGNSIYECTISNNLEETHCFCLVSGLNIIVPLHSVIVDKDSYITIKRYGSGNIVVDRSKFSIVYEKEHEDVAVLRLPTYYPTPFKTIVKHFTTSRNCIQKLGLVTPIGNIKLDSKRIQSFDSLYDVGYTKIYINGDNTVQYDDIHGDGMCGLILASEQSGVLGMHVAGSDELKVGVSMVWSLETLQDIIDILLVKPAFELPQSKDTNQSNSVVKLDIKGEQYLNTKSSIVESPLYNCFACEREPADLVKFGRHTVKDVAKKSFKPIEGRITPDEKDFARSILNCIISDFSDISEFEVIKGNDFLSGLNKDSSNGYKIPTGKDTFIDFENGKYLDVTNNKLKQIKQDILEDNIQLEDHIWFECLKDEIRDKRKDKVPRSFRVSTLWNQLLTKGIFGELVMNLVKTREFHGIQVGVNPYKHWDSMYRKLQSYDLIWDADVKEWDGKMSSEVQNLVNEVILSHYQGSNKEVAQFLLQNMVNTPVVINDDVIVTTHSMPSGDFLTAIFNSLVNKVYTAMWFRRYLKDKATIYLFFDKILDWAYGDDKVCGTNIYPEVLNALSMRDFFESLGMEFTDATKQRVTEPGVQIKDISFLKRKFLYHPFIGKIMCPLDLKTIYSSLSWVDSKKDVDVVMQDKLHAFQREIYLHPRALYKSAMSDLKIFCERKGVSLTELPETYLLEIYKKGEIPFKGLMDNIYL